MLGTPDGAGPRGSMSARNSTRLGPLRLSLLLLLAAWPLGRVHAQTAAELLEQARQHDAAYVRGDAVDRQKALALYEQALAAQPDPQQRLQTLFRMAQLEGCIYDRSKGEKPDFRKAINFYQQIVESYPPEEPMVLNAIGLISDHYTSLRDFDAALTWAKRAIDYDTAKAEERLQNIERRRDSLLTTEYSEAERHALTDEAVRSAPLWQELQQMKAGRVTAVDRLAHVAELVDPLRAHGELRAIADKYSGTPIGDRATQKLQEMMDRQASLWTPNLTLPQAPASSVQPAGSAPVMGPRGPEGVETPPGPRDATTPGPQAPDPNTTTKPKRAVPLTKSPRAPPLPRLLTYFVVAAGLTTLGLAARKVRKKTLVRNSHHET